MNNKLAVRSDLNLQTMTFDEMERLAHHYAKAGIFKDIKDVSQAIVKITLAKELGISAFAAMAGGIYITKQGQVGLGANAMAGKIKGSGRYTYLKGEHTAKKCVIEFFENGEKLGDSEYTLDDAKTAGLLSKDNWKNHPKNMLFARAMSNGAKWFCPDLWSGIAVYSMDEIEEIEASLIPEPVSDLIIESTVTEEPPAVDNVARQKWIDDIMAIEDYPRDGNPANKVAFINAQIRVKELNINPVTVPEILAWG